MHNDKLLKEKYSLLLPHLDEKSKRLYLASETIGLGRGGISKTAKLTGISRVTLTAGIQELRLGDVKKADSKLIRKAGGGRKKSVDKEAGLVEAVLELVSPYTVGDPMNTLLWTSKSTRKLSDELKRKGFNVSYNVVNRILSTEGFSLQGNKKVDEGGEHEDRDAQFVHINKVATEFIASSDPVISVDCKKKELVGNFKNSGREWYPKGKAPDVLVYDFEDKELGKAVPYGVYDIEQNQGWVSVGINYDTAKFAVSTIRNWWYEMGVELYGNSKRLLITADGGGSNSSRSRLWKSELQLLSNELNMEIVVSHFPPGTSKWNKIEHKMFSYISLNWRAKPLINIEVIVKLIAGTTTSKGLLIKSKVDEAVYEKGIKITDEELLKINIKRNDFHGEWNYSIAPNM
jgi:transposase